MKPAPKSTLDDTLTLRTAFSVMQHFLTAHWNRCDQSKRDSDLRDLLSFTAILPDRRTADPAMILEWLMAADTVIHDGKGPIMFQLKTALTSRVATNDRSPASLWLEQCLIPTHD